MNVFLRGVSLGLSTIVAAMLTGCGSGSTSEGASQSSTGILNLSVSDSPIKDAAKVCIKFNGVELKKVDEGPSIDIDFDEPVVINLLANQGAVSETLISEEVEAGTYKWIRLKVDAATANGAGVGDADPTDPVCSDEENGSYLLTDSGALFNIWVPSGDQTGLKLIKDIVIPADGSGDYTAEWDLGMSFVAPPGLGTGEAIMRPVVKLVQNEEVGTLNGTVADALLTPAVCDPESEIAPSVYVYDDDGDPDNPVNGIAEPVATGLVDQDMQGMPYTYEIGQLYAGRYEAAFTCNGADFVPGTGKFAEIFVGETTTVDFLAEDAPGNDG
jgi:hypothetical protein